MSGSVELGVGRAQALLASVDSVHVAGVVAGQPLLREVNSAVVDGALCFHGGSGEKAGLAGNPVVVGASRSVARVASWMLDPERACSATTLYWSVQATGILEEVIDPGSKARCLQGLMGSLQPEGGH